VRKLGHLTRVQGLESLLRLNAIELRVGGFHDQEEPIERGALNTGWYGMGSPLSASIPNTAVSAAKRIVVSNATGMNDGQDA
jgi:hypothetical protein